jgi:DNA-binding MarR family transcriptional regulator
MWNTRPRLQTLAEFRHELRSFLQFSERAAAARNLPAQQHQLLLQIAGVPDGTAPTVAYAAERLGLRHHSIVELSKRCEAAGLLARVQDSEDRRRVLLQLTPAGSAVLEDLSDDHAAELNQRAPKLIAALKRIQSMHMGSL